jgi:hypothetical protein
MSTKSKDSGNWVDRLVTDPAAPPQLQVLSGYRGRAASEDGVRLYQQADLSSWVDVPVGAVIHESEATDSLGLTRTFLWVKAETALAGESQGTATGEGWLGGPIATALGQETGYTARAYQRTVVQPPTGIDPRCPTNVCTVVACKTSWGPLCPNPPQPQAQAVAFQPEAQAATAFCASAACPPVTQFCPQPTHFCPPSVVCPPRTTFCPTNICPTNAQVCATLTNACNTLFCPTQHATCPPSFGGGLCPTMVCDPFGGR